MVREKQKRENIFKKKPSKDDSVDKLNKKKIKTRSTDVKNALPPHPSSLKISDIYDMLEEESEKEENVVLESETDDDGSIVESEESENEEITEKLELKQRENIRKERSTSKKIKELLPIKTKSGVVPRYVNK